MTTILDETFTFHPQDDKTNLYIGFTVPEGYDVLKCECRYTPKRVEDKELARQAAMANIGKYTPRETAESYIESYPADRLSLVNLITFSLDYEDRYIGCAHRHAAQAVHIISESGSSPGFIRQGAEAGSWRAVINVHSITSLQVEYFLKISALTKEENESGI